MTRDTSGEAATVRQARSSFPGGPGAFLQSCLFAIVFWLACGRGVDLRLIYHGGGVIANFPVFYWGTEFFQECMANPAGLLSYVHALFSQCLFHPWAGPAAAALLAWLLVAGQAWYLERIGAARLRLAAYLAPLLLLASISKYVYYTAASMTAFSVLAGVAGAGLYVLARLHFGRQGFVWLLTLGLLASMAASTAFPVFFLLCLLYDLQQEPRWRRLAGFLMLAGAPLLTGWLVYDFTLQETLGSLFPFTLTSMAFKSAGPALLHSLYFGLPFVLAVKLLASAVIRLFRSRAKQPKVRAEGQNQQQIVSESGASAPCEDLPPRPKAGLPGTVPWIAETSALAALCIGVWYFSANEGLKSALQTDFFSYQKMWPQVLEAARRIPDNIHAKCAVNQALYHTGRLGDDLPLNQNDETLLLYDQKYRPDWNVIDLYLELGFINMADHYLVETVELYGERPSLLRRLALVNAAIGNTGTARIYFNALKRVPFHAAWARDYLLRLESNPSLAGDGEVDRMRQMMPKGNFIIPLPVDALMLKLLEANKNNRMAFEYLMAHCLLSRNIPAWVEHLNKFGGMIVGGLPRHYQEAAVLAARGLGLRPELQGQRVDEMYLKQYEEFIQQMKRHGNDRAAAAEALHKDYADSYFYFYYFQ